MHTYTHTFTSTGTCEHTFNLLGSKSDDGVHRNQMVVWRTALMVIMKTLQTYLILETLETLDPLVKTVVMEITETLEAQGAMMSCNF